MARRLTHQVQQCSMQLLHAQSLSFTMNVLWGLLPKGQKMITTQGVTGFAQQCANIFLLITPNANSRHCTAASDPLCAAVSFLSQHNVSCLNTTERDKPQISKHTGPQFKAC